VISRYHWFSGRVSAEFNVGPSFAGFLIHGENLAFRQFIKSVELFPAAYAVAEKTYGAFTSARHK